MLVSTILTSGSLLTRTKSWAATMVSENRVASMGIVTVVIGTPSEQAAFLTCQQTI